MGFGNSAVAVAAKTSSGQNNNLASHLPNASYWQGNSKKSAVEYDQRFLEALQQQEIEPRKRIIAKLAHFISIGPGPYHTKKEKGRNSTRLTNAFCIIWTHQESRLVIHELIQETSRS